MPHPEGDLHVLTIDKQLLYPGRMGHRKDNDGISSRFHPKTEKFGQFRSTQNTNRKQDHRSPERTRPIFDGQCTVWVTLIGRDRFYKWDRKTRAIEMFRDDHAAFRAVAACHLLAGHHLYALFRGAPRVGNWDPWRLIHRIPHDHADGKCASRGSTWGPRLLRHPRPRLYRLYRSRTARATQ